MGILPQLLRQSKRRIKPEQGDISGLIVGGIFARSLAKRLRVGRRIQYIVDHLESQSDRRSIGLQR